MAQQSASDIDRDSIEGMSFCPTEKQVTALIEKAKEAQSARSNLIARINHKSEINRDEWINPDEWRRKPCDKAGFKDMSQKLLSKMYWVPNLCPTSLNPDDTILVKIGKGGLQLSDDGALRVIDDPKMPFGADSCGPNGVLTVCKDRINLFYESPKATQELLNKYLTFRNAHLLEIFDMFVKKIQTMAETMQLGYNKDGKPAILSVDLQPDYRNVKEMFSKVLDNCKNSSDLAQCGIGCNSFCQTWLRNGGGVGDAQFSVMSPHFQTRFYVTNDEALKKCGVQEDHIQSYIKIIRHFNKIMGKNYGCDGGGQAFVNLDKLQDQFNKTKSDSSSGGKRKRKTKRKTKRKSKRKSKKSIRKRKKKKTKKRRR